MKIAVILFLSLLILLSVSYLFLQEVMVTRPAICKYCHFISPYYNKWEQSTHKMVPCLKCHEYGVLTALSGQLRFIAGTYNPRPLTNVPDRNCLQSGCHERRLIESKVIFTKWNIVFDHKPHLTPGKGMMELHCRSCHSDIVQGEHMKVSVNVCFLCHLREGEEEKEDCTLCHTTPKQFVRYRGKPVHHARCVGAGTACKQCHESVLTGKGTVPKEKCFFCHINRTEKYRDVDFVHRQHVTGKQLNCFFCHEFVEHGNIKMSANVNALIQ
jgi:hypothetical protein